LQESDEVAARIYQAPEPRGTVWPGDARFHHGYAMWTPHKEEAGLPEKTDRRVWRVREFLGLDRMESPGPPGADNWKKVADDPANANLAILDDADLGFRGRPDLWPRSLNSADGPDWILLKMARPVARGGLWQHLIENYANRLIVVMTVDDLRLTDIHVSRELSWERTAQDLFWELVHNPSVRALSR